MKGMLFSAALAVLLMGGIAKADFTGSWVGTGEVEMFVDKQSQGTAPCAAFIFDITQTATELVVEKGFIHCGANLEIRFERSALEIRNGRLWDNAVEVGTIDDTSFHVEWRADKEANAWDVRYSAEGPIQYSQLWTDGYTALVMIGKLTRQVK